MPQRTRVPEAWPVIVAVAMDLIFRGLFPMGFWVVLAFSFYLRPSECMALQVASVTAPILGMCSFWSFNVASSDLGKVTKVGEFNHSVLFDQPGFEWVASASPHWVRSAVGGRLWHFGYRDLAHECAVSCGRLSVTMVPYQLRHSGPSWDRCQNFRQLDAIQKRGGWKTSRSVARYEKAARSLS